MRRAWLTRHIANTHPPSSENRWIQVDQEDENQQKQPEISYSGLFRMGSGEGGIIR
ncbi:MAG: hypothetical protein KFH87_11395 [Bacteroidetes bacterium]|nr:hypothetical protein [Bacteroidota bacterium]